MYEYSKNKTGGKEYTKEEKKKRVELFIYCFHFLKMALEAFSTSFPFLPLTHFCLLLPTLLSIFSKQNMTVPGKQ